MNDQAGLSLHHASGDLTPAPPFDLGQSLAFLGLFRPTEAEQVLADRALTKAVLAGGQVVVVRLVDAGTVEAPRVRYTLTAARPITPPVRQTATERIRAYLSLDVDLRPFYALGQADPVFAPIVERLYGYHQVLFLTPFENACWAILSQRTPMAVARRHKAALVDRFGGRLVVDGVAHQTFPEPGDLAGVDSAALTAPLNNERKAAYLSATAQAFASVDEGWLRTGGYDDVAAWLLAIPGIGPWSASFIMIRGLGRTERLTVVEPALLAAAQRAYGAEQAGSADVVRALAAPYGAWQGYWAHYLRAGTMA